MCGIVVVYSEGRVSEDRLGQCARALERIRHRGPDHQRVMGFDRAVLAHARLSIVDPSERSHQPFSTRDGRWTLVWNGEIYNHAELREELRGRGVEIEGHSDTEVLLYAFLEWGEACLPRLNGMWALAIYDRQAHELFLARDRFGIKPLYWCRAGGEVFAASELKALLPFGLPLHVRWDHMTPLPLHEEGTPPREGTIFEDVDALPAGTFLRIGGGQDRGPRRFWRLEDERVEVPRRFEDRVAELRRLLMDAVKLRTRNDVPTAIALSGGIDSSSIYGTCQAMQAEGWTPRTSTSGERKRLQAFTAEYPGEACDESRYALACGELWRDPEGITRVHPDVRDLPRLLEETVWHQEVPTWSPAAAGYHAFYREVGAAGYRVILEGHGADEMLGGYRGLAEAAYRSYRDAGRLFDAWRALRCAIGLQRPKAVESLRGLAYYGYRQARRRIKKGLRGERTSSPEARRGRGFETDGLLRDRVGTWELVPEHDRMPFSQALHVAFTRHPQPMFLRVFDRASMAHGLESAAPFLDHRLVRYVFSLPDSDKVREQSKRILRHAAWDWLPEQVRERRSKQGFSAPLVQWFNRPGMRDYLEDSFRSTRASGSECVNARNVIAYLDGRRGRRLEMAHILALWPALNLVLWENRFAHTEPAPRPRDIGSGSPFASPSDRRLDPVCDVEDRAAG